MNVSGAIYLCCFFFLLGRDLENCLKMGYLHRQERWASFLYREQLDALFDHYLARLSRQVHTFSLLGTADDHFHAAGAQRVPVIPLFVLLLMFLLHILTPMKKLIFRQFDHWVASHCTGVRRIRHREGNRWNY